MVAAAANAKLLPSPAEIRQACASIRRSWTEEERRSRRLGGRLRMRLLEIICDEHDECEPQELAIRRSG
jgi:hypothetical protein